MTYDFDFSLSPPAQEGGGGEGDTQIVTVGELEITEPEPTGEIYIGFEIGSDLGSIDPGLFAPKPGTTIVGLYWYTNGEEAGVYFYLDVDVSNDGWTTMTINGTPFLRSEMVFADSSWHISGVGFPNPFTAVDTETTVTFT